MKLPPFGRALIHSLALSAMAALACPSTHARTLGPLADPAYSTTVEVRWDSMMMESRVSLDLRAAGIRMPAGRTEAERRIERGLPSLLQEAVFGIPVDSRRTVGDALADGTLDISHVLDLLKAMDRRESRFSPDFRRFTAVYELPLTGLALLLVRHTRAAEPAAPLDYAPTRPFSGIVIYARGELPVHGEHVRARVSPSLFPRIFDDRMNTILERNHVSPEAIGRWGVAGYSYDLESAVLEERTGDNPLRIVATAVFGTQRTDIVITRNDALRILGLPVNRAHLREGRVLIVLDRPTP